MTTSIARALVGAAIALAFAGTLLTAPSNASSPAETPAAPQAGPGYHQPKVGSCHRLTKRQAFSWVAPNATVPCTERHTSRTIVVKRLRGKDVFERDENFLAPIFGACTRKAQRILGNNDRARAMSAFETFVFIPTKLERARGAKWMRCDLALLGGPVLHPLPQDLDLGSPPLAANVARCLSGPERNLQVTVCAKKHTYRVTGGFRNSGKRYEPKRLEKVAIRRCRGMVSSRTWRYQIPMSADRWNVGYRTTVCYTRTRN